MLAEIHGSTRQTLRPVQTTLSAPVQKAAAQEAEQPAGPEELQDLELERPKLPVEMVALVPAAQQLVAVAAVALEGRIVPEGTGEQVARARTVLPPAAVAGLTVPTMELQRAAQQLALAVTTDLEVVGVWPAVVPVAVMALLAVVAVVVPAILQTTERLAD